MKINFKSVNLGKLGFDLSREFGDDSFNEPDMADSYGSYGNIQLVGHGRVTNSFCGTYKRFDGCVYTHLHNKTTLDGVNYKGKMYGRIVHNGCHKFSCPICYKFSASVREAGNIEMRLAEASKRFGQVEHIVASVPVRDYGLTFVKLRANTIKALKRRGVFGGCLIFHGFRYNIRKQWYWSPHFHILGFIMGGFRKCRRCPHVDKKGSRFDCEGCKGFYGVSKKHFKKDGYIVEVMGRRKTVFGTAYYQLNHSSFDITKIRFHIATWFGACSYRKLKVTKEYKKRVCPICGHDLVKLRYLGSKPSIMDLWTSTSASCKKIDFFDDLMQDGQIVWVEDSRRRF